MSETARASGLTRSEHPSEGITATEPPEGGTPDDNHTGQNRTVCTSGVRAYKHAISRDLPSGSTRRPLGHPGLRSPSVGRIPDTLFA